MTTPTIVTQRLDEYADRKWRTIPGPWQDEPDKVQWQDEATGLPCMVIRGPVGALCGYVGVGPDHPFYKKDYGTPIDGTDSDADDYYDYDKHPRIDGVLEVHGSLTYSAECAGHICHVTTDGEHDDRWWFGFDCAHSFDLAPYMMEDTYPPSLREPMKDGWPRPTYRDLDYVKAECAKLAAQLAAVTE